MRTFDPRSCRGDWALVSGASSGIGQAYASRLAALGLNLVIVARRRDRLDALANDLTKRYKIHAIPFNVDLSHENAVPSVLEHLTQIRDLRLRMLINNAGVGKAGPAWPHNAPNVATMIRTNCEAMVLLTLALVPMLLRSSPSAIVHLSSQAAYQPVPYMAIYAATKSFVHNFSLALYEELRDQNIHVQTLVPAPTNTEFDKHAGVQSNLLKSRALPDDVVDASLRGLLRGDLVTSNAAGLWKQRLFAAIAPPKIVVREVAKIFRSPNR